MLFEQRRARMVRWFAEEYGIMERELEAAAILAPSRLLHAFAPSLRLLVPDEVFKRDRRCGWWWSGSTLQVNTKTSSRG
jgi:hypothetical protein